MADYFTRYLTDFAKGALEGLTNPKGQQANYRHASRLFLDNNFRLSPRTKFLFYVNIKLNSNAVRSIAFSDKHAQEIGFMVRSIDLPKYNFDSVVKNQYNRKKIIYKNFNYEPITVNLRDDNGGLINSLWALYYGYYIADRSQPNWAYDADQYRTAAYSDFSRSNRYGLDNDYSDPFIDQIDIYTMSRRRFISYTLVNPKIKSWQHGNMDYSSSDFNEASMTLEYEAVRYDAGEVGFNQPQGFADLYYDSLPSPLSVAGGGVSTLTGSGGVLDGLESVFGSIGKGTAFSSPRNFLGTAIAAVNTYKNASNLTKGQIASEAVSILSNPAVIASGVSTIGGLVGKVFPKSAAASNTETVTAQPKVIATSAFTGRPVTAPPGQ